LEKKEHSDQLEDIVDIQDHSITLSEIESIATSVDILKQYEKDNKESLYSSILLSLTHETYSENEARLLWNEITEHMKNLEHALGRKHYMWYVNFFRIKISIPLYKPCESSPGVLPNSTL